MGLFTKKNCSVCGEQIGLLGNRKLEDGNLCKHCAGKLSPWFNERRHSTVEDIIGQLQYREENRAKVAAFQTTFQAGESHKLFLDEPHGCFMVAYGNNLESENPDVIPCQQITGVEVDVADTRTEVKKDDGNGSKVSYNPPLYDYNYTFYLVILVNHPYIDKIRFSINSSSIKEHRIETLGGQGYHCHEYTKYASMAETMKTMLLNARSAAMNPGAVPAGAPEAAFAASVIQPAAEPAPAPVPAFTPAPAAAPKASNMTCPVCGASTVPDAAGCCEYCGSKII